MSVRVADLHLERPGIIDRGFEDGGAFDFVLLVKRFGVFYADPDPGSGVALVAFTEVNACAIAGNEGEIVSSPVGIFNPRMFT